MLEVGKQKLKNMHRFTTPERKILYLQLTDYYQEQSLYKALE